MMHAWTRACVQFECVVCMLVYDGVSLLQKRMSFFFSFFFLVFFLILSQVLLELEVVSGLAFS